MNQKIADTQVKGMSLNSALANNEVFYSVDYYQRSYAWERKQVIELMDDLFIKFHESYAEKDTIRSVPSYKQYFLGSYVLSRKNSTDYVIDGQQRLTTLTLLFMAISHISKENQDYDRSVKARNYVYSDDTGDIDFKIAIPSREKTMLLLLDEEENIPTEDDSCELLVQNYWIIRKYLYDNISKEKLPIFFQWLATRVLMVSITAYDDTEAYTIFETMNDRGKSLTNLDMLKGLLLSMVSDSKIKEASETWRKIEKSFDDNKEFDKFIITLFRAMWAEDTAQMKSKSKSSKLSDNKNDWSEIYNHYHRFVKENRTRLNLTDEEDVLKLIDNIYFYSCLNTKLKEHKEVLTEKFEDLHKLHKFNLPYVDVLLFALISPNDKDADTKIQIITKFLDIRLGIFSWNMFDSLNDSNMSRYLVTLIKRIRSTELHTDYNILSWFFYNEIESNLKNNWAEFDAAALPQLSKRRFAKKQVFYMLANFSSFLEDNKDRNIFSEFYDNKDSYEIEHMLASNFEHNKEWYKSEDQLNIVRNDIGALGLLRKSINSSLNNMPYKDKLNKYQDQNTYLALLSESFYKADGKIANKPDLNRLLESNPSVSKFVKPYEKLDENAIEDRNKLCLELAKTIWNKDVFHSYIDNDIFETMDDIQELMDGDFPVDEEEEEETKNNEDHSVGDTLCYSFQDIKLEGIYQGKGKITLTKITNAPLKDNFRDHAKQNFNYFKFMYPRIIKDATIDKANSRYSWNGRITNCPTKALINLAHGYVVGGHIKLDEIVNITKEENKLID